MARVSISNQNIPSQGTFVYSPSVQLFNTRNAVLSDTHVFSPAVVNEFRFGFNRGNSSATATMEQAGERFHGQSRAGLRADFRIPHVELEYAGPVARRRDRVLQLQRSEDELRIREYLSVCGQREHHPRRSHLQDRRGHPAVPFRSPAQRSGLRAITTFGSTYTANPSLAQPGGLPYADFLLGLPTGVTNSNAVDWSRQRDLYVGPYIQDDWKITHRLTLNIGFRYDLYTQPVDAKNTGAMFDPVRAQQRRTAGHSPTSRPERQLASRRARGITGISRRGSAWPIRPRASS